MNVYRRFFKVTSGDMLEKIEEIQEINKKARKEYKKFMDKIGAEKDYYVRDQRLVGIIFKEEPDRYLYKRLKYGWWPKKNTKAGNELNAQLKSIKTLPENSCLELIGLSSSPTIFMGGKCYRPTLVTIPSAPPILLVSVPWYDEKPDTLAGYIEDKAKGNHRNCNYDAILWKPITGMEEIKEWQYLQAIDDWNASLKDAA